MENSLCRYQMFSRENTIGMTEIGQLARMSQVHSIDEYCNYVIDYNSNLPFLNQLNEQQFMLELNKLTLTEEEMRCHGYPIWHRDNCVSFFNTRKGREHRSREWKEVLQHFYLNPEPLYPAEDIVYVSTERSGRSTDEEDGDHGSGSSDSVDCKARRTKSSQCRQQPALKKDCARCKKQFYVSAKDGECIFQEECFYHWGKVRPFTYIFNWSCCNKHKHTRGCTFATQHVWSGVVPGHNGPYHDYARSINPPFNRYICDSKQGAFALDCEMVFTKNGMEVAKVSLVNICGEVVYDSFVKPSAPVIDYNTRFSGLSSSDLAYVTKTLRDVQTDILSFVNTKTILMGHSLESDLRALKIVHMNVIDTSILYPHELGPPRRRSLKELVHTELQKTSQYRAHNSAEDARAVIDLVLLKMNDIARMYSSTPFQ